MISLTHLRRAYEGKAAVTVFLDLATILQVENFCNVCLCVWVVKKDYKLKEKRNFWFLKWGGLVVLWMLSGVWVLGLDPFVLLQGGVIFKV